MPGPDLSGRVALVTGAAGDLGRAMSDALVDCGARTAYLDVRTPPDVAAIDARPGSTFVLGDVTDEVGLDAAVERLTAELGGPPTIVVNNAGVVESSPLHETTTAAWSRQLAVNLTGAFVVSRRVLPGMRTAGYGRLVHLSSLVAATGGTTRVGAYAAAKAGLEGLSRAVAAEYAADGITSNVIAPAWIDAGMFAVPGATADRVPVGRLGTPRDVVAALLYLVGPDTGFVTGQCIAVDGGVRLR